MKIDRIVFLSLLLSALVGCGGGGTSGGSGLPSPADDFNPLPNPGGDGGAAPRTAADATAEFTVDVTTGEVTITPLTGSRAVFGGSAIEFDSSQLLDEPGSAGLKALDISLVNRWGLPIGENPDGTVTGLRADVVSIEQQTALEFDLSGLVQVSTLAGSGAPGAAAAASMNRPFDVAEGPDGSLYIAALADHRIYRLKDGSFSVLAGHQVPGYADGAGDAARFFHPIGIAWSEQLAGLVVVELSNRRVRRVTVDGVVTTIAGSGASGAADGAGPSASFEQLYGVAVAPDGTIYVTDAGSQRLRRIEFTGSDPAAASSFTVSTLAGGLAGFADAVGTNARFESPFGIAVGPDETIYVADQGNRRVRRVSSSGEVVTVAGTGVAGSTDGAGDTATFQAPFGLAYTEQGLYVSDSVQHTIRLVSLREGAAPAAAANWQVRHLAGTGSLGFADGPGGTAQFRTPVGITPLADQSIAIADSDNGRIRHLVLDHHELQLGVPSGGTSDVPIRLNNPDGHVPNGPVDTTEPVPFIRYPGSLDPGEESSAKRWVFLIDEDATLFRFTVRVEATTSTSTPPPVGIGVASDEVLVTTILDAGQSTHLDGPLTQAAIASAEGISVDRFGNVYIAQDAGDDDSIRRIAFDPTGGLLSGEVSTVAGIEGIGAGAVINGSGLVARFHQPNDVEADSTGKVLYLTDTNNHVVRRAELTGTDPTDPADWTVATIAGVASSLGYTEGAGNVAQFDSPYALALADDRTIYVSEFFGNRVRRLRHQGGSAALASNWQVSLVAGDTSGATGAAGSADGQGGVARFDNPTGIDIGPNGRIYVADSGNAAIRVIDSAFNVSTLAGNGSLGHVDGPSAFARFVDPRDLVVDDAGFVYVADNRGVRRVDPAGNVTTVAGSSLNSGNADGLGSEARFSGPDGIGLFPDGTLIVVDQPSGDRVALIRRVIDKS